MNKAILVILLATVCSIKATHNNKVLCEFYDDNNAKKFNASETSIEEENAKELMICGKESQFCYALWITDNSTNKPKFIKQGCWEASPPTTNNKNQVTIETGSSSSGYCQKSNCTAYTSRSPPSHLMNFCCCQGDGCNGFVYLETAPLTNDYEMDEQDFSTQTDNSFYYFIGFILLFVLIALVGIVGLKIVLNRRLERKHSNNDDQEVHEELISPNNDFLKLTKFSNNKKIINNFSIDDIIATEIATGRWGRIYTTKPNSTFGPEKLALKLYTQDHRDFFLNEKLIYECLGNEHENILRYHGWTESPSNLVLAFDLVEFNLRDFLKIHHINPEDTVNIILQISKAVAYLHGGVAHSDTAVAHRDLTSRNILITGDKHIYLADFGLSLLTQGSKYFLGGREREAEFCSLAEAGTLRYMAPELLEGAVNLKDCENALKQADVYSLSLILWEVAHSSQDLTLNSNNYPHSLPYDEEAGHKDLTLDDVVRLVVVHRYRPGFHDFVENGLTRSIRDTLNEAWDSEPDARLTSLCIVERLTELKSQLTNKFLAPSGKPLEPKRTIITEEITWVNRNTCMERNLNFDNNSSSIEGSNVTQATNLSTTDEHKINNVALLHINTPKPIQHIINITK